MEVKRISNQTKHAGVTKDDVLSSGFNEVVSSLNKSYKRMPSILLMKLEGKTTKEIADYFSLCKDRIRQQEAVGIEVWRNWSGFYKKV